MSENREEKVLVKNHIMVGTTGIPLSSIEECNESHVLCITKKGKDGLMDALIAEIDDIERKIDVLSEMGNHGNRISEENDKLMIAKDLFYQINEMRVCER